MWGAPRCCATPRSLRRGGASVIHCTVQNITSGGACLKLANTSGVPDCFELTFELGRTRRPCRVIWRTADQLGVAFEEVVTTAAVRADVA